MNWYVEVLKKYAVFYGRAGRLEYWYFVLFNILITIGLGIIDNLAGTFNTATGSGLLGAVYALAVLVPSIAVAVRRLHDTGRSGWWLLIILIPIIGAIILLVFLAQRGDSGENAYGPPPKAIVTAQRAS